MSNPEKKYLELAEKLMKGTITPEEKKELYDWYNDGFDSEVRLDASLEGDRENMERRIFSRIKQKAWAIRRTNTLKISRYAVAAVSIIVIGFALAILRYSSTKKPHAIAAHTLQNDIAAPASQKAILTLASGEQIYIDSIENGSSLATTGSAGIQKTKSGALLYQALQKQPVNPEYNTLSVPRGGQVIHLTLSDGTKIWLNSESSLRFPVVFQDNQRNVEITGEAYFEVARDPKRKFIVKSANFETEVLGTHFNVNTYSDESASKITLFEGSVKVSLPGTATSITLSPGQQATVKSGIAKSTVTNMDAVIAWKDGMFVFDNLNIAAIMRQLSRWYNFSLHYSGDVQNKHFTGSISRNESTAQVLHMLELTDVIHFKITGNNVTITP